MKARYRSLGFMGLVIFAGLELMVVVSRATPNSQEERVSYLRDEIARVIQDIDQDVQSVLDAILPLTDTKETGNKVTVLKESTMAGLRKVIDSYVTERQKLEGELARPVTSLTKEQLTGQVGFIDEKIDERIGDIMQLSASLAESKEFDKYEYFYDPEMEDYDFQINEDYRQNRKVQSQVTLAQRSLDEGLVKSIKSLQDRVARYERLLPYQTTDENRAAIEQLIADTRKRLDDREEQRMMLGERNHEGAERTISKNELQMLNRRIEDQKKQIRSSFDLLRRLKAEYDAALMQLNRMSR